MADKFDILNDNVKELKEKVSNIETSINNIDKTLAINTESLKEHMRRSELNEEALELMRREMKPIEDHVIKVNFITKIISFLVPFAGAMYYIIRLIKD